MYKRFFFSSLLIFILIALSISGQSNRSISTTQAKSNSKTVCFSPPVMPIMLNNEVDKLNFLALHWWDNFAFDDISCIQNSNISERAFQDFIHICASVNDNIRIKAVNNFMQKTKGDASLQMYRHFYNLAEKYFYNPNSPFRNEEHFALYIDYVLADNSFNQTEKIKPKLHLQDINKNRIGTKASDFEYITSKGTKNRLHNLKTEYILIYFNNPDCEDCKRSSRELKNLKSINQLIAESKLTLLSVYVDEDIEVWQKHQKNIPNNWIDARDGSKDFQIQTHLYSIRAIPSLYLLDKEQKVILKDVDVEEIEEWLMTIK